MKKLGLSLIIGLMSFSSFAEGTYVQCDMKIKENETSIDLLKVSKKRVRFKLPAGGSYTLDNDVIRLVPYADDNQKYRKHQVALFKTDERYKELSSDIPYARIPISNPTTIKVRDAGHKYVIEYYIHDELVYSFPHYGEPPFDYNVSDKDIFKFKYTPFEHDFFSMKNNHIWGKAKKGKKLSATHVGKIEYKCHFSYEEILDIEYNDIGEDLTEVEEFEVKRNPKKSSAEVSEE